MYLSLSLYIYIYICPVLVTDGTEAPDPNP